MKIAGIIPARYGSTRFPGKPLADIKGKTMIRRVYEQASKAGSLHEVVVATDDDRIIKEVESFGGKAVMSSASHSSGTERCAEVLDNLSIDVDVVINIQGDEPFIDPGKIDLLAAMFSDSAVDIATLSAKITDDADLKNPNVVKLVSGTDGKALYFSRSVIPFLRNAASGNLVNNFNFQKHIGIYAYRSEVLRKIVKLPEGTLEKAESLEQLRWLEHGFSIFVSETESEGFAIDTPDDLSKIINI